MNERITVKLGPHVEGERRFGGILKEVSADSLILEVENTEKHEIKIEDITQAKTVFEWKKNPKPGKQGVEPKVSSNSK